MNRLLVYSLMVLLLSLPLIQSPAVAADPGGTTPQVCSWQIFYNDQGELDDAATAMAISPQQLLTELCNSRFSGQTWVMEGTQTPGAAPTVGTGTIPTAGAPPQVCSAKLFYSDQGDMDDASKDLGLSPQKLLINLCNSRFGEQGWTSQEVQNPVVTFGPGAVTAPQPSQAEAGAGPQACGWQMFYSEQSELDDASKAFGMTSQQLLTNLCNSRVTEQASGPAQD